MTSWEILDAHPERGVTVWSWGGMGMVSIDYSRRCWCLGGLSVVRPATNVQYNGRGWRERLERDAKAALEEIYKDEK